MPEIVETACCALFLFAAIVTALAIFCAAVETVVQIVREAHDGRRKP